MLPPGGEGRTGRAAGVHGDHLQHGAGVADAQVERLAPHRLRLAALGAGARGLAAGVARIGARAHRQAQVRVHRARRAPQPRDALRQLRLQHLRRAGREGGSPPGHRTRCRCTQ